MAQCHADATHEGSRISSMLCKYTIWKFPYYSSAPRQCNMKDPQAARCHASATHEGSQMSSVPCQRNTWRFPTELSAMPAQYMKAPEQARCHVSALHEGSRTSSETQKLLVQAIEETVRNVKFFLKANSVIEEQKSTVRFAGTCSWSDCISSPNISSFVGHGLMNGAVAPCSAFTSRVKVRMYMSLCLHVIAGFTHTRTQTQTHKHQHVDVPLQNAGKNTCCWLIGIVLDRDNGWYWMILADTSETIFETFWNLKRGLLSASMVKQFQIRIDQDGSLSILIPVT